MTDEETGDEAVAIANEIEGVLDGRDTAAALLAIGMVVGRFTIDGKRPNLEDLLDRLKAIAASTMRQHGHGGAAH